MLPRKYPQRLLRRKNPALQALLFKSALFPAMRFIHINEYEYMNNYLQCIILHTCIRILI